MPGQIVTIDENGRQTPDDPRILPENVIPPPAINANQRRPLPPVGAPGGDDTSEQKIRVLIAKPGLDGHDRGAKVVARALRDAGMEVIYTGLHQTPEQIVETAIQEDVNFVGLSILSGAHMTLVPKVVEMLKQRGADDIPVGVGGIIPEEDEARLREKGVRVIFGPGTNTADIVSAITGSAGGD